MSDMSSEKSLKQDLVCGNLFFFYVSLFSEVNGKFVVFFVSL